MIIKTDVVNIRDPFVLVKDGVYYMYGTDVTTGDWDDTDWVCYKNESGRLDAGWERLENLHIRPSTAEKNLWSPEVHEYKGSYYMICTYFSSEKCRRGCTVMRSSSPAGPFSEISDGFVTESVYPFDAIDGTLYVDENAQPWLVFVNEWTQTDDKIGRMSAARLSDDLSTCVGEMTELFRADDASWSGAQVTDGCFMYKTAEGKLLMLWSNLDKDGGYCVGIAESENGKIVGKWCQNDELLFARSLTGELDGGHSMIFKALDGKKYLALHSPNKPEGGLTETAVFVPVYEKNGTLVCEI